MKSKTRKSLHGFDIDIVEADQNNIENINMAIPLYQRFVESKKKRDLFQTDYQNQLLLYNILLLNTYYKEIPLFIAQR